METFIGLSNRSRGEQCSPVPHRYAAPSEASGPALGGAPRPSALALVALRYLAVIPTLPPLTRCRGETNQGAVAHFCSHDSHVATPSVCGRRLHDQGDVIHAPRLGWRRLGRQTLIARPSDLLTRQGGRRGKEPTGNRWCLCFARIAGRCPARAPFCRSHCIFLARSCRCQLGFCCGSLSKGIPASRKLPRQPGKVLVARPECASHAVKAKADARRGEAKRSQCVTQVLRRGAGGPVYATRAGDRRRLLVCYLVVWALIAIAVDKHG